MLKCKLSLAPSLLPTVCREKPSKGHSEELSRHWTCESQFVMHQLSFSSGHPFKARCTAQSFWLSARFAGHVRCRWWRRPYGATRRRRWPTDTDDRLVNGNQRNLEVQVTRQRHRCITHPMASRRKARRHPRANCAPSWERLSAPNGRRPPARTPAKVRQLQWPSIIVINSNHE